MNVYSLSLNLQLIDILFFKIEVRLRVNGFVVDVIVGIVGLFGNFQLGFVLLLILCHQ